MKLTIGYKIGAGYAFALALLVIIGIVAYSSVGKLVDISKLVTHTNLVLYHVEELGSGLNSIDANTHGYYIAGEESYLTPYNKAQEAVADSIKDLRKLTEDNPQQQKRLDMIEPLVRKRLDINRNLINLAKTGGLEAAKKMHTAEACLQGKNDIRKVIDEIMNEESEILKQREHEAEAIRGRTNAAILFGTLISFVILILASFFITRSVIKPLAAVVGQLEALSAGGGDLRLRLSADSSDETGDLSRAFNRFMENLSGIIRNLMDYATKLSSSATEIGAATEEMSRGADSQMNQVMKTSSGMAEMAASVQEVSRNARNTSDTAASAAKMAKDGSQKVNRTVSGISGVNDSLRKLKGRSEKVGKVVQFIGEIAAQTNILALNAAIEAARAGEHGRGFDVVAEEIRRLAQKTTDSTAEIAATIEEIQSETREAVNSMEASTASAIEAGQSIDDIVEGIVSTTDMIQLISSASAQQARTSEEIADALQNISGVNKQTAQASREVAKAIQDLSLLAEKLKEVTDKFRV
jgi:methyl-accepting chemotaxis protein